jgi:hypothetical protein
MPDYGLNPMAWLVKDNEVPSSISKYLEKEKKTTNTK